MSSRCSTARISAYSVEPMWRSRSSTTSSVKSSVCDPLLQLPMHADVKQQTPVLAEDFSGGPFLELFLLRTLDQQHDLRQPPRRVQFQLEPAHAIKQPVLRQQIRLAVRNVESQRSDPPVQPDHAAQQTRRNQQDRRVHAHQSRLQVLPASDFAARSTKSFFVLSTTANQ